MDSWDEVTCPNCGFPCTCHKSKDPEPQIVKGWDLAREPSRTVEFTIGFDPPPEALVNRFDQPLSLDTIQAQAAALLRERERGKVKG